MSKSWLIALFHGFQNTYTQTFVIIDKGTIRSCYNKRYHEKSQKTAEIFWKISKIINFLSIIYPIMMTCKNPRSHRVSKSCPMEFWLQLQKGIVIAFAVFARNLSSTRGSWCHLYYQPLIKSTSSNMSLPVPNPTTLTNKFPLLEYAFSIVWASVEAWDIGMKIHRKCLWALKKTLI